MTKKEFIDVEYDERVFALELHKADSTINHIKNFYIQKLDRVPNSDYLNDETRKAFKDNMTEKYEQIRNAIEDFTVLTENGTNILKGKDPWYGFDDEEETNNE